jgi:alpha-galactosidase
LPAAKRPVMGYNTWYQYRTNVDEADVLRQARLLVSTGLAATGYNQVNLDDGWMANRRTSDGGLGWNSKKFPHGIPWLAAKLHSMGLKFGIYEAIGTQTCQHFPGSWGHYAQDAQTFAQWSVVLVKVDECGGLPSGTSAERLTQDFESYGEDLREDMPSFVYSEELPIYEIGKPSFLSTIRSSASFANMWRVAPDEYPLNKVIPMILGHLAADLHLHSFAGPGHWNDLDMVAPDMPASGWTRGDLQSQLSVWAEEASPLLISADLSALTSAEVADLKNPHLIGIDQSGSQAPIAVMNGTTEAVIKGADGGLAILLANLGHKAATGRFSLSQLHLADKLVSIYNVWTGSTSVANRLVYKLPSGHTALLVLKGVKAHRIVHEKVRPIRGIRRIAPSRAIQSGRARTSPG